MRLREIAYSRSGDKGNVSNICVFPYEQSDWERIRESITADRVKQHFRHLVQGEVTRYVVESLPALNFVLTRALAGGVSISLRTDPHGKAFQSLILDMEVGDASESYDRDPSPARVVEDSNPGRVS